MKQRQSNFELLRILAMLFVVLLHVNEMVLGGVNRLDVIQSPVDAFVRSLSEQFCCVCVNVFILISGWFGIKTSFKGVANIIFQVFFYTIFLIALGHLLGWEVPLDRITAVVRYDTAYWFVSQYLLLYLIAPALNSFVDSADDKRLLGVTVSLFTFEFVMDWQVHYANMNGGNNVVSFIALYLLARYLATRESRLSQYSWKHYACAYFVLTLLPCIIGFAGSYFIGSDLGKAQYTSPFVVAASVSLLLMFSKFQFVSKPINYLACSAFAVYLIHISPISARYFKQHMTAVYDSMSGALFIPVSIAIAIVLCIACMLIDKVRIYLWSVISRKIFKNS